MEYLTPKEKRYTMTEKPTKLIVCCCGSCEAQGHPKEQILEFTVEEIAEAEKLAKEEQERQAEYEAGLAAKAAAKQALLDKLGITQEEAALLLS